MKRILGIQLALLCMGGSLVYAAIAERSGQYSGSDYKKAGDYGMEVYNKTGQTIWYAIKNGDDSSGLFMSRSIAGNPSSKQYTIDID